MVLRCPKGLLLLGCQVIKMGINAFERVILGQKTRSAHGTHALHSGHIVGRITAYCEHIYDLRRTGYAVLLADLAFAEDLIIRTSLSGLVLKNVGGDELAVVLVRGDHIDVHSACEALGHRSYHVVGFEVGDHQHRDVKRAHYPGQGFERIYHELRRRGAIGLIIREKTVSECPSRRVEGHCYVRGLLPMDEFEQVFGKAKYDGGVLPLAVYHRAA